MAALPEDLGIEVEALSHLYGDDSFQISSEGTSTTLSMPLLPRQLDGEHEAYVAAKLVLKIDNLSYPTTAATAILEEPKGLTDAACSQLETSLQAEAENLVGEMVLGHLCELALDLLTEANHPNGNCIFCLEDVIGNQTITLASSNGSSSSAPSYQVLKLPCFHCFHIPCFTAWFQWQQAAAAAAAAEPLGAPGSQQRGSSSSLPACQDVECEGKWMARNVYTIKCPSCRLEVPPTALRHALPQLLGPKTTPPSKINFKNSSSSPSVAATWSAEHLKPKDVLSPDSLKQVIDMQKRFKRILDLQKSVNGLVQENVAVSVAELEAAAAEKRLQQQQQKEEQEKPRESAHVPSKNAPNKSGGGGGRGGRSGGGRGRGRGGGGIGRGRGGQPRPPNNPPPPPSSS